MPHIILFEDGGFFGNHKHVFGEIENLATDHDSNFNDRSELVCHIGWNLGVV